MGDSEEEFTVHVDFVEVGELEGKGAKRTTLVSPGVELPPSRDSSGSE